MNVRLFFAGTLIGLALITSCSYNKTELPQPEDGPVVENPSGTVITYTSHVEAIMVNNCTICHGGSGNLFLNTYTQVKAIADNGKLSDRAINGLGGPMPQSGLMPQATRDILQMWLDQGALE